MARVLWKEAKDVNGKGIGLLCSNTGIVKVKETGQLLKLHALDSGYIAVYYNNLQYLVHRLVVSAFKDYNIAGFDIHHIDHNRGNNNPDNLEIIDRRVHAGLSNALDKEVILSIADDISEGKLSPTEIANKYDITYTTVKRIIDKKVYTDLLKKYDFSAYPYGRAKDSKQLIEELREGVRNGLNKNELMDIAMIKYGRNSEKAYYYVYEAKKYVKKEKEGKVKNGKRGDYRKYHNEIDLLIMNGKTYREIFAYLKAITQFDDVEIRNLIHRRVAHHKKHILKGER